MANESAICSCHNGIYVRHNPTQIPAGIERECIQIQIIGRSAAAYPKKREPLVVVFRVRYDEIRIPPRVVCEIRVAVAGNDQVHCPSLGHTGSYRYRHLELECPGSGIDANYGVVRRIAKLLICKDRAIRVHSDAIEIASVRRHVAWIPLPGNAVQLYDFLVVRDHQATLEIGVQVWISKVAQIRGPRRCSVARDGIYRAAG